MKICIIRLLILCVVMVPKGACSLETSFSEEKVDNLSSLPKSGDPLPGYERCMGLTLDQMVTTVGCTVAGFIFLYAVNPALRKKIATWLGLHAYIQDQGDMHEIAL